MQKKYIFLFTTLICLQNLSATVTESDREERKELVHTIRDQASDAMLAQPILPQQTNNDFLLYSDHRANFAKGPLQKQDGFVDDAAFQSLITALSTGLTSDFNNLILGEGRGLVSPQSSFEFLLKGLDNWTSIMPQAPALSSSETAAEMVELYWTALVRDIPFNQYESSNKVHTAAKELSSLSGFTGPKKNGKVTPQTFLRGNLIGDLQGPYISQFLYQPVPFHHSSNNQHRNVPEKSHANDFMTTFNEWHTIQNGGTSRREISYTKCKYYIRNARDLADFVHEDFPSEIFMNTALTLLHYGPDALDSNNLFRSGSPQEGFVTFGIAEILNLVAEATKQALFSSWYQKWLVHLRLRPEYCGFLVDKDLTDAMFDSNLHSDVLTSKAAEKIYSKYGSYFLPQTFPEGSPTHPSYPAGHAVISGACTTVLKAFFNEDFVIPHPVKLNKCNTKLEKLHEELTVGHELNKLASNVCLGRNHAGVHYRSDGDQGVILGETIAIFFLNELGRTRSMPFQGYSLTMFDGTKIVVGQSI